MSNLIQIKRSLNTAAPTSLANGELAYTANGDALAIGSNGSIVYVGGKRTPGTLTANQALVANATGFIDTVKAANVILTSLNANGTYGTNGQVLVSNGTVAYWGVGTSGSDTQVQFNDGGIANGSAGFTFVKTSNTLAVGNTLTVNNVFSTTQVNSALISVGTTFIANTTGAFHTGTINAASFTTTGVTVNSTAIVSTGFANITTSVNSALFTVGTGFTANATLVNAAAINIVNQVNTATLFASTSANVGANIQTNTTAQMISSNSTVNTIITAVSITQANTTATPLVANATGIFHTGTINAASHTTTGVTANVSGVYPASNTSGTDLGDSTKRWIINSNTINSSGLITGSSGLEITGTANASTSMFVGANVFSNTIAHGVGNSTVNSYLTSTLLSVSTATSSANLAAGVLTIGTSVVNTTAIAVGDLIINGNTTIGSNTQDLLTFNSLVSGNLIPSTNNTSWLGNNSLRFAEIHAGNVHSQSGYFDGDVQIAGNLSVTGSTLTVNVATLSVSDALIQLGSNNLTSDLLDIGFFGNYNSGADPHEHAGLFRDASDNGIFKLFLGLQDAPTTTVNTASGTYTQGTLQAYLLSSGLTTNSSVTNITANSTVSVTLTANTLYLSNALLGNSGGTGLASYTSEDIIVANTTNGFRKLSLGSDGYVLQSNGTALLYNSLDGGSF